MTIKGISAVVLLLIILVAPGHTAETSSVEQQIRQMEIARLAFPKDISKWADNIADDALFMHGTGEMLTKRQTIEYYRQNEDENSTDLMETEFRQSGDTAVFSYISKRKRHDNFDGAVRQPTCAEIGCLPAESRKVATGALGGCGRALDRW